ncbi:SCO6880 family protein [Aquipuribacter nitratireducens]|uniref:SCO6880 family protein n=1 Tax=Aquipuribacter nitratireducens TaxID=650104 RepID=A0ABW0GQ71_9MICO
MAVAETTSTRPRTYGNWRRPTTPGLLGMGALGTLVLFVGLVSLIITWFTGGFRATVPTAVLFASALALLALRDRHGATAAERLGRWGLWRIGRRRGLHLYRSGPQSSAPWGTYQLPGLLAPSQLSEWTDSWGRPFALLRVPSTGHYSVVFATEPDGASLVDAEQVDLWVAQWGAWLASIGSEAGLVGASVTVETAPDSGSRLKQEVEKQAAADAPAVALAMLSEVVTRYPEGSATIRAWVTLTFSAAPRPGARRRTAAEVGRDLASRLPVVSQGLLATGAGGVRPVGAQELCEFVRVAYDPSTALTLDEARHDRSVPELRWSDVGPTATEATWSTYRHDSAVSVTWAMTAPPRGEVYSSVLHGLLNPHPDVDRKRVTLAFRPLDAARAARIVEIDKRAADFRATVSDRPSARAISEQRSAAATAAEEALGAGLVDFSLLVTATVADEDRLPDAIAAIDMLSASARLQLRPMYGSQDVGFAASLPLGLVLPAHSALPTSIRSAL